MGIVMGLSSDIRHQISDTRKKSTFLQSRRYYLYLVLMILILGYAVIVPYLADIYARRGEYRKAITQNPLCGEYHFKLANLYVKKYRETKDSYYRIDAYEEFKRAIRLEPIMKTLLESRG